MTEPIKSTADLQGYGLRIPELTLIQGVLTFEAPVSIGLKVNGECSIGAFTYAGSGEIRNASIGRYCSIGGGLLLVAPNTRQRGQ
jgi:hypothetical protein